MLYIQVVLGIGRLFLPESIHMRYNMCLITFCIYRHTPFLFIPYNERTFFATNKTAPDNNRFFFFEFGKMAGVIKLLLGSSSNPDMPRSPFHIEGAFVRPYSLRSIVCRPNLVDICPCQASLN